MSPLMLIVIILLIVVLFGGGYGYRVGWYAGGVGPPGYGIGIVGIVLVVLLILLLTGRL